MDKYDIQINKTSRNTVLFMTNIGTTRSSVAYLIEVLVRDRAGARRRPRRGQPDGAQGLRRNACITLMNELPPLPDFTRFHDAFRAATPTGTPEGDIREAFFLAYDEKQCEYFPLEDDSMEAAIDSGRELVSTSFIIPYPPGFPILVPGQVISQGDPALHARARRQGDPRLSARPRPARVHARPRCDARTPVPA